MHFIKSIIVAAAALAAVQAHAAYSYSFTETLPAGAYAAPSFTDGFQASTQTNSVANVYMQPQGITGSYLVVSSQPTGTEGHATISTGGVSSYSFVWGSPDDGNTVDIYSSASSFTSYTGAMLKSTYGLVGDGMNGNTGLFTITADSGSVIDHLVLKSTNVAFEMAAPVPEPETYALMLAGLGALGFMARRRKQA